MSTKTSFVNSLSRELDKEVEKETQRQRKALPATDYELTFRFTRKEIQQFFDRAALIVLTRELDKQTRLGSAK